MKLSVDTMEVYQNMDILVINLILIDPWFREECLSFMNFEFHMLTAAWRPQH